MVKTGFSIGDRDWWIMVYLPVTTERELSEVYGTLLACGCPDYRAQNACMTLSKYNKGYTYTNFKDRSTVVFASKATSPSELYDSLQHELKHVVEHIGEYYNVDPKSEESAYLQGEIARLMFPAVAIVFCPKCGHTD